MKKNIKKRLSTILAATIATAIFATSVSTNTYAHTVNADNNTYYTEVSYIAASLTVNFKDKAEKECCYNAIMTGVFGEHFNDWDFRKEKNDLIYALDEDVPCGLLQCFIGINGTVKYVDIDDGKHYYCPVNKTILNKSGINETNYATIKSVYQAAEMLKTQTDGMNSTDKARFIHDYMIAKYEVGDESDSNEHSGFWMVTSGEGVCSAYMTMFTIFGRYCGLDVSGIVYRTDDGYLHTFNTVTIENGETRCIDVMWDDTLGDYSFFMETIEQNLISHPRM